jgi:hypothetical protein
MPCVGMMMKIMNKMTMELPETALWFKIVAGVFAFVVVIAFYFILRPASTPGGVVNEYVTELARNRCDKAYDLVSYYARNRIMDYSTYEKFKLSVCEPVAGKYIYLEMYHIEDVIDNGTTASVLSRLKFKMPWMPKTQFRTMGFNVRREGRYWKMDGPELQP